MEIQELLVVALKREVPRGNIVVAVEFQVFKRGRDAEPAGHRRRFGAGHSRLADNHNGAAAHRAAHQDYFQLNRGLSSQIPRAEKKHTGRTDVPRNKRYRKVFRSPVNAAEPQRKPQARSWIFALLREYTHR